MPQDPLTALLAQRAIAQQKEPLPTRVNFLSSSVEQSYPIMKAIQMLGDVGVEGPTPPISVNRDLRVDRLNAGSPVPNGTVNFDVPVPRITLFKYGPIWQKAESGKPDDLKALAGSIMHEMTHVKDGPSEEHAYNEQLRILRDLKARQKDIDDTAQAQSYIKQNERGRY